MKIGICGSTAASKNVLQAATMLGEQIGQKKHDVIIGTNAHLPYYIAAVAHRLGSRVIGYSPSIRLRMDSDPQDIFNEVHFLPEALRAYGSTVRTKIRNMIMVGEMDAAIIVAGQWGTTTEFGMARSMGIPVAMLKGSGGAADALPSYIQSIERGIASPEPLYLDNPALIIDELETQFAKLQQELLEMDEPD